MAKKQTSKLSDILTALQRIIVLCVAAFGLTQAWPIESLVIRAAVLWAVLYLASEITEVLFRYLSHSAATRDSMTENARTVKSGG